MNQIILGEDNMRSDITSLEKRGWIEKVQDNPFVGCS